MVDAFRWILVGVLGVGLLILSACASNEETTVAPEAPASDYTGDNLNPEADLAPIPPADPVPAVDVAPKKTPKAKVKPKAIKHSKKPVKKAKGKKPAAK